MQTHLNYTLLALMALLFTNCGSYLEIDRSQFLKDGDPIPTVDLKAYRSVQERPGQDPALAVAMAISGGGSRASNFGVGIMMGLERIALSQRGNALDQVDYLSTVSGGGFAGGAYVSARFDHHYYRPGQAFSLAEYVERNIRADLQVSYVGALARGYFNPKVWFSFVDYGDALEKAINEHVLGYGRRKYTPDPRQIVLGDLFISRSDTSGQALFPMHITNSSAMGTLAIFPFTPDILATHQVNGYTHQMKIVEEDSLDPYSIPLSVGIKASGSFPVLIPNTTLHSDFNADRRYLHIMDGAMTDNQGYYTALEVLKQEEAVHRRVLLIVDADASGNLETFSKRQGAKAPVNVFFSLAASGLYARRATMRKDLSEMGEKFKIKPIFLAFSTLVEGVIPPGDLPARIKVKDEQRRLIGLLKAGDEPLSDHDRHILYELLINIGTKYTIKPEEQDLLFLAGQLIVKLKEEEIREAMSY